MTSETSNFFIDDVPLSKEMEHMEPAVASEESVDVIERAPGMGDDNNTPESETARDHRVTSSQAGFAAVRAAGGVRFDQ